MTTGSKVVGTTNDPFYLAKTWSGGDDPKLHRKENPYLCDLTVMQSGGQVQYCEAWGCASCTPAPSVQLIAPNLVAINGSEVQALYRKALYKAQTRVVDSVRGHDLDLGNYVPEGRETAAMVAGAITRLRNAAKALRRGDVDMAVRAAVGGKPNGRYTDTMQKLRAKDISSAHLAVTYGIMPLLSDIYETANAWEKVTSSERSWLIRRNGSAQADLSHLTRMAYFDFNTKAKVRAEYKVFLKERLSTPRSLGLYDPLGMLWEGTPFSFVVDWFIPIGTYLDNLNVLPYVEADIFLSTRYRQKSTSVVSSQKYPWGCSPWGVGYNLDNYQSETTHIRVQRGPASFSSSSIAGPSFKPINLAMSEAHLKNAAALIHQIFF